MLKLSNTLLSIIQNFAYIHQITKQKCNKFVQTESKVSGKKRRSEIKRNKKKNKREKEKGLTDQWLRDLFRLCVWRWRKSERDVHVNVRSFWTLCLWRSTEWCFLGWAWHRVWLIIWHFGLDNANNEFLGYFFNIRVGWVYFWKPTSNSNFFKNIYNLFYNNLIIGRGEIWILNILFGIIKKC